MIQHNSTDRFQEPRFLPSLGVVTTAMLATVRGLRTCCDEVMWLLKKRRGFLRDKWHIQKSGNEENVDTGTFHERPRCPLQTLVSLLYATTRDRNMMFQL
jgi:hypothetical protein